MLDEPLPVLLLRWAAFAALLATIGAAVFRGLVLGPVTKQFDAAALEAGGRRVALFGALGAAALIVFGFGRLVSQVSQLRDPGDAWTPLAATLLFGTPWGIGVGLQAGGGLLAAAGFLMIWRDLRRGLRRMGWVLIAVGTIALAAMPALSGHAVGSGQSALAVAGDTLHVLGAGAWLGALACMFVAVLSPSRGWTVDVAPLAALARAFSPIALAAAGLVVASGVLGSWLHLGAVASLWETAYGRLLTAKVVLFGVVAALGAFNWQYVLPRLDGGRGGERLRRATQAELLVALVVLFLTAVLVATPLPGAE